MTSATGEFRLVANQKAERKGVTSENKEKKMNGKKQRTKRKNTSVSIHLDNFIRVTMTKCQCGNPNQERN